MARASRANFPLDWISRFRCTFLPLLFLDICLFAVVPQLTLVDSDDDGITDLSGIVIGASLLTHPTNSTARNERTLYSHTTVATTSDTIGHLPFGAEKANLIFRDPHLVLASLSLLRC